MTKFEAGEVASDGLTRADRRAYEAKVAGPEREVGQLTMELDLLKKGGLDLGTPCQKREFRERA